MPFSRLSVADVRAAAVERGLPADVSGTTLWRWLAADAIRPWAQRSWIFPRDPDFAAKAARVLDLCARSRQGAHLRPDEYVISADEKTQLQVLHVGPPWLLVVELTEWPRAFARPCVRPIAEIAS